MVTPTTNSICVDLSALSAIKLISGLHYPRLWGVFNETPSDVNAVGLRVVFNHHSFNEINLSFVTTIINPDEFGVGMHSVFGFMASIWQMPWYWRIWVGVLMMVNGLLPFVYLESIESKVILVVFALAAMTQMFIYHVKGFVRLLGIGHIFWIPMLGWLLFRINEGLVSEAILSWIASLLLLNTVSLFIDLVDVVRYWRGERASTILLQD